MNALPSGALHQRDSVLLKHVGVAETENGIVLVNGSSQKSVIGLENSARDPSETSKFRT